MVGIKCIHCDCAGIIEDQGTTFNGQTNDMRASRIFKHEGHNPFSGYLHYQCPECQTIILIDPMDVLGESFVTDVRSKPKSKGFFRSPLLNRWGIEPA
jgi:hypothetical protein